MPQKTNQSIIDLYKDEKSAPPANLPKHSNAGILELYSDTATVEEDLDNYADEKIKEYPKTWLDALVPKGETPALAPITMVTGGIQETMNQLTEALNGREFSGKAIAKAITTGQGATGKELLRKWTPSFVAKAEKQNKEVQKWFADTVGKPLFGDSWGNFTAKVFAPLDVADLAGFTEELAADPSTYIGAPAVTKAVKYLTKTGRAELRVTKALKNALDGASGDVTKFMQDDLVKSVNDLSSRIEKVKKLNKAAGKFKMPEAGEAGIVANRGVTSEQQLNLLTDNLNIMKDNYILGKLAEETVPVKPSIITVKKTPFPTAAQKKAAITQAYKESDAISLARERTYKNMKEAGFNNAREWAEFQMNYKQVKPKQYEELVRRGIFQKPPKNVMVDQVEKLDQIESLYTLGRQVGMDSSLIEKLPVEEGQNILRMIAELGESDKTMSLLSELRTPGKAILDALGGEGVPLYKALQTSAHANADHVAYAYPRAVEATRILEKHFGKKGSPAFKEAELRIYEALSNRDMAPKILKSEAERQAYEHTLDVYEYVRKVRMEKKLPVLENYATKRVILDELEETEAKLGRWGRRGVDGSVGWNDDIAKRQHSVYSKERKGTTKYSKYLYSDGTMDKYISSMSRELAFDDLVKLYWKDYADVGNKRIQTFIGEHIRDLVEPKLPLTKSEKPGVFLTKLAHAGQVMWNVWQTVLNTFQTDLAKMVVSGKSVRAETKLLGWSGRMKKVPKNVSDYFDDIYKDYSNWQLDIDESLVGKVKGFWNKGIHGVSETRNWAKARTYGRFEALYQNPAFLEELKKTDMDPIKAVDNLMSSTSPEVQAMLTQAKFYGEQIAMNSQVPMGPLGNPAFLRKLKATSGGLSLGRMAAQYKRFQLGAFEHMYDSFSNKGKLISVLQRGFDADKTIVDGYKSLNYIEAGLRKNKEVLQRAGTYDTLMDDIARDKKVLKGYIDQAAPGETSRKVKYLSLYIIKGTALMYVKYKILAGLFKSNGMKKKEPSVLALAARSIPATDVITDPQNLLASPALPPAIYSQGGVQSYVKGLMEKGIQLTPGLGAIDSNLGGLISKSATKALFPEKKKRRVGGRRR